MSDASPTSAPCDPAASTNASSSRAAAAAVAATEWTRIGSVDKLPARAHFKLNERYVTLLRIGKSYFCMDSICYHAGGPLMEGSVKRIGGRMCIQCPWHRYLVDVKSGEGLYMDLDRKYRSKGVRQRTHEVKVEEGEVWVKLSQVDAVASDEYAFGPKFGEKKVVPEFPGDYEW